MLSQVLRGNAIIILKSCVVCTAFNYMNLCISFSNNNEIISKLILEFRGSAMHWYLIGIGKANITQYNYFL